MAGKNVKKRNWWFVLYPESAPKNWREELQQTGLQCAISPPHDRDVYEDGEHKGLPKKLHHHVILCYAGPTSYSVVCALTNGRLGQTIPQPLESIRGAYRYLTHEDNPEKFQYSKADIVSLNGFDYREFVELTKTEVNKIIRDIQGFIIDSNILEYSELLDILRVGDGLEDWYDVAISHTLLLTAYLRSRREKGRIRDAGKGAQTDRGANSGHD